MKNNIYFIYLLLLAVLPVHSRNTSLFSVYEITCEQQIEPSGIGSKSPRFSWKVACQQRGYRQSAYRILVADTEDATFQLKRGDLLPIPDGSICCSHVIS